MKTKRGGSLTVVSSCDKMWKGILLVLVAIYLIDTMYVVTHNVIIITMTFTVIIVTLL